MAQTRAQPKENKCIHCGGTVAARAKFCTHCGQKLDSAALPITHLKLTETPIELKAKQQFQDQLQELLDLKKNPTQVNIDQAFQELNDLPEAPEFLAELLFKLLHHPYKPLREQAALVLIKSRSGKDQLLTLLGTAPDWIRSTIISVIGQARLTQAVPLLIGLAEKDSNPWLQQDIVYALGEIGDIQAFNFLMRLLTTSDQSLVQAAARSLKALGDPAAIQYLLPQLTSPSVETESIIFDALQSFGTRAAHQLIKLLADHKSPEKLKAKALMLLEKTPDPMATPILINLLAEANTLAQPIIKVMASWKLEEFIPVLEAIGNDRSRELRLLAQSALQQIKQKEKS